jgi:hypothetical protein
MSFLRMSETLSLAIGSLNRNFFSPCPIQLIPDSSLLKEHCYRQLLLTTFHQ